MIINFENLTKSFGAVTILSDISGRIEENGKIGLVGINGCGKTTFLNIISGIYGYDSGILEKNGSVEAGYLKQNDSFEDGGTIISEMQNVFADLYKVKEEMDNIQKELIHAKDAQFNHLSSQYNKLLSLYEANEGYITDVKIANILNNMGFESFPQDTPVAVLSGGEKTRLALSKLLLREPSLLILDEPTNHLDFKTITWLENYLKTYKGALLLVSHDRYFLNALCTDIWEIDNKKLIKYKGNYENYVVLKRENYEKTLKEYYIQKEEIEDLKDFVARNMARASTSSRAKSRQKQLDKMEIIEKPKGPRRPAKFAFNFERNPVSDVLHASGLSVSFEEGEQLFHDVDFDMMRGDKIALIGENGIGKTTFLKLLLKLAPKDAGKVEWGRNTDISYFEQGDIDLNKNKSILDELWDRFPRETELAIRSVLGNVQITGENVYKKISALSGGERARLKFAILILSCGNVLLMDEPTNHLDLDTKEALDTALVNYEGTLLVISHDRYLLNKFPTKIAVMHSDHIKVYNGKYDDYLAQAAKEKSSLSSPVKPKEKKAAKSESYRSKRDRSLKAARDKEIKDTETHIAELEDKIARLEGEISGPALSEDYVLLNEKCTELEALKQELEIFIEKWTGLC